MEIIKQIGFQGDVQVFEISALPNNAKKIDKTFIAESSSSGSFHALFGEYDQYQTSEGFIIDVKKKSILNHSLKQHMNVSMNKAVILKKKDHNHCVIPKGIYFFGIQMKFDPLKGLKEKVKD